MIMGSCDRKLMVVYVPSAVWPEETQLSTIDLRPVLMEKYTSKWGHTFFLIFLRFDYNFIKGIVSFFMRKEGEMNDLGTWCFQS